MIGTFGIQELRNKFQSLAFGLDVEPYFKVFHTTLQHDGSPHIETDENGFRFVVSERGSELYRIDVLSEDDTVYLLFEGITFHMATSFELGKRVAGIDGRSIWFPYQENLVGKLNPSWAKCLHEKHESILKEKPFHK